MFHRKISRMKETELEIMAKMASAELQAVYFGHVSGYKHKFYQHNQGDGQISSTNWWSTIVKIHANHY